MAVNQQYKWNPQDELLAIPKMARRTDELWLQLRDLHIVAQRIGCKDAADWLRKELQKVHEPIGKPKKR